jgi:hypothetical protein
MFTSGSQGIYEWLVTDDQFVDLLQICSEIVVGKYVAITSVDSGVLALNDTERVAGWESRGKPATPIDLGTSHLGENIFEVPDEPGEVRVFVNYCFAPHLLEMRILPRYSGGNWNGFARSRT